MGFPLLRLAWCGSARPPRSYGKSCRRMKRGGWLAAVTRRCVLGAGMALVTTYPWAAERIVNIVAFGDSGLAVNVVNAGVSGDTTAGGLARLDWSVPDGTDAVILELGANDALRGFDPAVTRKALDTMLRRLQERKISVLLCGMVAPPNMGAEYGRAFNAIYPDLAAQTGAILYPFFLTGVAADPKLNQRDGLHPTAAGVAVIVDRILPQVEELIARAKG